MATVRRRFFCSRTRRFQFESLEPRLVLASGVVINEFLASNTHGIFDSDGAHSDWIELQNTSASVVNLNGWYLTDDAGTPTKWQFPSTSIAAGGYLVVFASGKDRRVAGQELHTNFELGSQGGYLALEMPDQSIAFSYVSYPAQLDDISYGITGTSTTTDMLVDEEAPVRVGIFPTNSSISATWTTVGFNDTVSPWQAGTIGVGYDTDPTATNDYRPFINLDVGSQMNVSPQRNAAFLRLPFELADKDQLTSLTLQMHYDDGFVAYINGTEVARANATGTPGPGSSASNTHTDSAAQVYQPFPITSSLSALVNGSNVLAIAGLNQANNLTDFLIDPLLSATRNNPPTVGYMSTPTPGSVNNAGSLGFVADTHFSVDRGFYSSPFDVTITTATPGAEIRYTLDGTAPTAATGLVYTQSIHISTTANLRAAAFKAGYTSSNVDTQTYVFLNDVIHQTGTNLPTYAAWGHAGADWDMDPDIVNSPTYASQMQAAMTALPTMSITLPWSDMFGAGGQGIYIAGSGVPKASSTEFFTADGSRVFQIDDSIQIQGGTSDDRWKQDKLSFRLKFTDDYGPSKLDFPLFTNSTFDQGATHSFDTLILDAESNNVWTHPDPTQNSRATYIQDQFAGDLQNLSGGYAPHGAYAQLYINGLYWGVYYVHERADAAFASSYLGDDKDNYDVLKHNPNTPVNNSTTAVPDYAAFLALVRQNMTVQANYQAVTNKLDVKNFVDYMIINYYVGNTDWASSTAQHNWYVSYDKVSGTGKWRFHNWDAEHIFENVNDNVLSKFQTGGPTEIFQALMVNAEFKQQFADEVQRVMFNGGILTPQVVGSLFSQRASDLNVAIIGESARWGDNRIANTPYTAAQRNANVQNLLTNYFPQRTQIVLNQFIAAGWFSSLSAPVYSQFGGTGNSGFQVSLSFPAGSPAGAVIYYTQDGSDPRATGGGISAAAHLYSAPISITAAQHLKARIYVSSTSSWSPLDDAIFNLTTPFPVRIVEMNYHPADRAGVSDSDDMEFIELLNTGTGEVELQNLKIDTGITFQVGSSVKLQAGQRIVIARNHTVFQNVYGNSAILTPTDYSGKLANDGEEIRLIDPFGNLLQDINYSDSGAWPGLADGKGSTLEIVNPLGAAGDPNNWRSSYEYGGTPDTAGAGAVNRVIVNEVLTHEDLPQVDAIELFNTTTSAINIGGWFLSDSSSNYKKYKIPAGTTIAAGQYVVIDATQFDSASPTGGNVPFGLSSTSSDDVYLLSADASSNLLNFEDHAEFDAAANNVSFGRWPNGTGQLYPMKSLTLGTANSGPLIGPVVITELLYKPTGGNNNLQFVELQNISNQTVTFSSNIAGFGQQPWKIDGIGYSFPVGQTLAPGATLVIMGAFTTPLSASGGDIRLQRPDTPSPDNPTVLPYVLVDEVDYSGSPPWPATPVGSSLTRTLAAIYGNDPANWVTAIPSPGQADLYAPTVAEVFVNGTTWTQDYRNYLASLGLGSSQFGYAIPKGANQAASLDWGNIDQISIQFNEDVSSHLADLSLGGVNNESYSIIGFGYDSATHTATWTLAASLPADQLTLHLTTATADTVGHPLDGEWNDNVSTGNSGNGLPGGDFQFDFNVAAVVPNVIRGDLDFSGQPGSTDISAMLTALVDLPTYQSAHHLSETDYLYIADINGDHVVNNADIQALLYLLMHPPGGSQLPPSLSDASSNELPVAPSDPVAEESPASDSIALPLEAVTTAAAMPEPIIYVDSNPSASVIPATAPVVQVIPLLEVHSDPAPVAPKNAFIDLEFAPTLVSDAKPREPIAIKSPANLQQPTVANLDLPQSLVDEAIVDLAIHRRRHASFHEQFTDESLADEQAILP